MPVTIRTTAPDITTNATYQAHKANLDCVSILTYQSRLVTAWDANGITVAQSQITALDASFDEIGGLGKSLILRPGISMNTTCEFQSSGSWNPNDGPDYNTYRLMTEAMGVNWIRGYVSGDPQSGGEEFDFPWPIDPQMFVLTEHVYEFLRVYLTATSSTTTNGVTFGSCPCDPGTPHARSQHVLEVTCVKPTFQFHEMTGGYSSGVGGNTNAALFHAYDGFGATVTSTNKAQRAEQTLFEWDRTLKMVYSKMHNVARTSIATGTVWALWEVNKYLTRWGSLAPHNSNSDGEYPYGWLCVLRTNLKLSWWEYPTSVSTNERLHLRQAYLAGITIGMQTGGTAPAGSGWGTQFFYGAEHLLNGVMDGANNSGYGLVKFLEVQTERLSGGTVNSPAVGDWAGGNVNAEQYLLSHANSVNSRLDVFTPWASAEPPPGPVGDYPHLGAYAT